MNKDIFISYRNDGEGNNFAARLCEALDAKNYSVYFNSKEQHSGSFPDRLKEAIKGCKDVILIVSYGCLEGLKETRESDWVRSEILYARENGKNITPVYIGKTIVPDRWSDYPKDIRFLFSLQSVYLPEQFELAPIYDLVSKFVSRPEKDDTYRDTYNSSLQYDPDADLEEILSRARSGDTNAMFDAAVQYQFNVGAQDFENAYLWYCKFVEHCDDEEQKAHAYNRIAGLYFTGAVTSIGQSFEKSYDYRKMAAPYNQNAAMELAAMKRIGSGCDFNYEEITDSFSEIKNPDCISYNEQAQFYLTYGRFKDAIRLFRKAQNQMPEASYQLGLLYKLGVHTDPPMPDCFRAAEYFRRAADNKHYAPAAYELGMLYYNPPMGDFEKNFEQAVKYFKIAADSGIAEAQYKLGWMYRFGLGCKKNIPKSVYYEELAANQGHIGGYGQLIFLYQEEEVRNYHKAFQNAKLAADAGYAHGAFYLANFYLIGRGCEANLREAEKYYMFALEHGVYEAELMLRKVKKIKNE